MRPITHAEIARRLRAIFAMSCYLKKFSFHFLDIFSALKTRKLASNGYVTPLAKP